MLLYSKDGGSESRDIPSRDASIGPADQSTRTGSRGRLWRMEPAQILIVDDEANMRKVLGALLKREGYHILDASRGEEAIALLEEHHVDTIVTDMKMPGMNGMEVLEAATGSTPICRSS